MIGLDSLEKQFHKKEDRLRRVYYLFFKHGITPIEMEKLPIPYIFGMLEEFSNEQEAIVKANKKK